MSKKLIKAESSTMQDYEGTLELEDLQDAVNGDIEIVGTNNGIMIVNESGLIERLPLNDLATELAGMTIAGDVVLLTTKDVEEFLK